MTFLLVFSSPGQFFLLKSYVSPPIVEALGLGLQGCRGTSLSCANVCPEPHSKLKARHTSYHFGKGLYIS